MEAIVTFDHKNKEDKIYADIHDFVIEPRIGEMVCIGDYDWFMITAVVHTDRQHEDGPPLSVFAEQCEPHPSIIRKKSETRDR